MRHLDRIHVRNKHAIHFDIHAELERIISRAYSFFV